MNTLEATAHKEEHAYRFCAEEFEKIAEAHIFDKSDRLELLDGEIIVLAPIGKKHWWVVTRIAKLFHHRYGDSCLINVQSPLQLGSFSLPQPDLQLFRGALESYWNRFSGPEDTYLLVEVSDSSLQYGRGRKLDAYAQAGITEYWIVNLLDESVEVFRAPKDGTFAQTSVFQRGEQVNCAAFPDVIFTVDELFPPRD